eukprot:scaffold38423_cov51-Attheya_sp.AAC.6
MDFQFDTSTHARSWLFSEESLKKCRETAASGRSAQQLPVGGSFNRVRVRNFASGYHSRFRDGVSGPLSASVPYQDMSVDTPSHETSRARSNEVDQPINQTPALSVQDEERIVRFHAHLISFLVGPKALFVELKRDSMFVATAILLFRRFYLSNSVIDFDPRKIAAASVFLAGKIPGVEGKTLSVSAVSLFDNIRIIMLSEGHSVATCELYEETIPYGLMSVADIGCTLTHDLWREVKVVSAADIISSELNLLAGLNFELICCHPFRASKALACDLTRFFKKHDETPELDWNRIMEDIHCRARTIYATASIASDIPFLFPPGQIAFASLAVAGEIELETEAGKWFSNIALKEYIRERFCHEMETELRSFEAQVDSISSKLRKSSMCQHEEISENRMMKKGEMSASVISESCNAKATQNPPTNSSHCRKRKSEVMEADKSTHRPSFSPLRHQTQKHLPNVTPTTK